MTKKPQKRPLESPNEDSEASTLENKGNKELNKKDAIIKKQKSQIEQNAILSTEPQASDIEFEMAGQIKTNAIDVNINNKSSEKTADTSNKPTTFKYDKYSKGPYLVMVEFRPKNKTRASEPWSEIGVSRMLDLANAKHTEIRKYAFNSWEVLFDRYSYANDLLNNNMVTEKEFKAHIPNYKMARKGVVQDVPTDITEEEILFQIRKYDKSAESVYRLGRRNKFTKKREPAESIVITFKGDSLPETVHLWRTWQLVKPFIANVRLCYKCGTLGHFSHFCKGEEKCLTCAQPKHTREGETCGNNPKCINCPTSLEGQESHSTLDRKCPEYQKEAAIKRVMAYENLPYLTAKKVVLGSGNAPAKGMPSLGLNNFPYLGTSRQQQQDQTNYWFSKSKIQRQAVSTELPKEAKEALQRLQGILQESDDVGGLLSNIWKAIELNQKLKSNNDPTK